MRVLSFTLAFFVLVGCTGRRNPPLDGRGDPQADPGKVSVTRGVYHQPVIRVENAGSRDPDVLLFEEQGFVEAKDRFLQMDVLRRAGTGRLAELFGEKAFQKDVEAHAVGLVMAAENSNSRLEAEHPPTYRFLLAFADGVNRYLEHLEKEDPKLLSFYRRLTGDANYKPAAWSPQDSVAIGESVAFYLSSAIKQKMVFGLAAILVTGGDLEKFVNLLDFRPVENISILKGTGKIQAALNGISARPVLGTSDRFLEFGRCLPPALFDFPIQSPCGRLSSPGSNNWVVSGKFAGGKTAYLANDPHLPLTYPILFYELALDSISAGGQMRLAGVNVPGIPGIMIGHNENIAWGFTNSMSDVDELYAESLVKNLTKVEQTQQVGSKKEIVELDVELRQPIIRIRRTGGEIEERQLNLRMIPNHGPVFSDHLRLYDAKLGKYVTIAEKLKNLGLPESIVFSYKWTGHGGSTELVAMLGVSRARNYAEFRNSLQYFEAGAQNIVYADRQGNIGFYSHGKYPLRPFASKKIPPIMPVSGREGLEWEGFRINVPELFNPKAGYIVTANNDPYGTNQKPALSDFEDYFGYRFAMGCRAKRIDEMLHEEKKKRSGRLDLDAMKSIQTDVKDLLAGKFIALLSQAQSQLNLTASQAALVDRLKRWNLNVSRFQQEPLLFTIWLVELMKKYAGDLLESPDLGLRDNEESEGILVAFLAAAGAIAVNTVYHQVKDLLAADPEKAYRVFEASLKNAEKVLSDNDLEGKRWGEVHQLKFTNILEGILPVLPYPPMATGGTFSTVNAGSFDLTGVLGGTGELLLPHVHGPVFRLVMVLEEGKPIRGINVLPTGVLGDLKDPKSIEELRMWRDGEYRELISY